MEETPKRRIGVKRWIVLALIIFGAYLQFGPLPPATPNIFLPGEPLPVTIPILNQPLTNTILAMLVVDGLLLLMGFYIWRKIKSGNLVPSGLYNLLEMIYEFLWTTTESTAGTKYAKRFLPIVATIFMLVLVNSWIGIIPGVDSIGVLEPAHGDFQGYAANQIGDSDAYWIDAKQPLEHDVAAGDHEEAVVTDHSEEAASAETEMAEETHEMCVSCTVTPFLRAAPTDLNFTLSLALISVFMTQVFGFAAQKFAYAEKYLNFKALVTIPVMGAMDFAVGALELIGEFVKILSFTFRLFGNIFAGQLLLFILGSMIAFVVPTALYLLEFAVAMIQAYVFYLLTLIFMSQATIAHGADAH
ncbi:MAG: F0F1 ATP synthase subunit A [Chloroflexota bacterium]